MPADVFNTPNDAPVTLPIAKFEATPTTVSDGESRPLSISNDGKLRTDASFSGTLEVNLDRDNDEVTVYPSNGVISDGSGQIAIADTSEEIFAANTDRAYLLVQNLSASSMWVNFGVAAVKDQPSIELKPNGVVEYEGNYCPTETVNIISAATGKYTAKQA